MLTQKEVANSQAHDKDLPQTALGCWDLNR